MSHQKPVSIAREEVRALARSASAKLSAVEGLIAHVELLTLPMKNGAVLTSDVRLLLCEAREELAQLRRIEGEMDG